LENFLDKAALKLLKNRKNLLAFSAGIDSTALFFLLLKKGIEFDIAIVNYKLRAQSDSEVEYAKELAKRYKKKIFIKEAPIKPPSIEEKAREIRYRFFEEIIKKENYHNLITAHQLNDQLEWFFMQFTKGAGVVELIGMEIVTKKEAYTIVRPLLKTSKEKLKNFLQKNKIKYFFDVTNIDQSYKRNYFRVKYCDPLIKEFEEGIKRSFEYLQKDKESLIKDINFIKIKKVFIAKNPKDDIKLLRVIDKIAKELGYLLTTDQKKEILKQKEGVVGGKIAFSINDDFVFLSPYIKIPMDKKFKEKCRVLKIPPKIRGYLYKEKIDLDSILKSLS